MGEGDRLVENAAPILQSVFIRNISSLAALIVLVCDYVANLTDEYNYIWKRPITAPKLIYIFARYLGLLAHIFNIVLVFTVFSRLPVKRHLCEALFMFLIGVCCALLAALDFILMLRVYVLYNRSWKVALSLIALLATEAALVSTCLTRTLPLVPFDPICDVRETPCEVVYFTASVVLTQVILLLMVVVKRNVAFGRAPVVHLVVREGAWIFVLVVSLFAINVPYSLFTRIARPHMVFGWPMTFLSLASCHVILNSIRPPDENEASTSSRRSTSPSVQFTTFLDLSVGSAFSSVQSFAISSSDESIGFDMRESLPSLTDSERC
ncbi:hypothetical protein BDQ12DRAFT_684773 [Crucibulum laeve]|uniref:DUF6533 domain-containing protein n=1 Tax=Crucibulum laeve TaxID=68775 RepID=A0A5C3LYV6_9AGAR|nr:hypothetical protein BDQ12DRAFT_684773 [Crucibulum laeve]